jgi:membrane dipeptidase
MSARPFVTTVSACAVAIAGASLCPYLFEVRAAGRTAPTAPTAQAAPDDPVLVARARAIHDRVITLDTHNDIEPNRFTDTCNYTMRLTTQVNLPKMKEGGLDVSFMIAYTGQGDLTPEGYARAYQTAVAKFDAVHRLTEHIAPKEIGLALTADDVRKIAASGRKVAVIGIENGIPSVSTSRA